MVQPGSQKDSEFRLRSLMKFYVLGASGFIGQHLCSYLKLHNHVVTAVSRRPVNLKGIENIIVSDYSELNSEKSSTCIHFAETSLIAAVGAEHVWQQRSVMDSLLKKPFDRILYASSAAVYGDQSELAHSETEEILNHNKSDYVSIKLENEQKLLLDSRPNLVVRFGNIYGPMMPETSVAQVIISQFKTYTKLIKLRSVSPVRDYLYVQDALKALLLLLQLPGFKGIFNIAGGDGRSVYDLVQVIAAFYAKNDFHIEETDQRDVFSKLILDVSKLRAQTGWEPEFDLARGISEMLRN